MAKTTRVDLIGRQITYEIIAEQLAGPESFVRRNDAARKVLALDRQLKTGGFKQKKPRKYRRIARRLSRAK